MCSFEPGTLLIPCAVSTILLHKPPECFYKQNWIFDNVQILQNLGSISKIKTPKWWHRRSNVLGARGPQILRLIIQNSDHHDDQAPGIYSALFFPLVNPRSSTDLGRKVDDGQCASVFIYEDDNGAQPLSSHRTLQRARVKQSKIGGSSIQISSTDWRLFVMAAGSPLRGKNCSLILTLLTWRIWWIPTNASKWQMGLTWRLKC